MKRHALLPLALVLGACGSVSPEHYVQITTNCRGPEESASFVMSSNDFETTCTGESFLDC